MRCTRRGRPEASPGREGEANAPRRRRPGWGLRDRLLLLRLRASGTGKKGGGEEGELGGLWEAGGRRARGSTGPGRLCRESTPPRRAGC